jgi:hypothetical protein
MVNKLMVALVLALGSTGLVMADPTPEKETPAPAKTGMEPITDVQLGQMLEGLGLEVKKGTYKSGALYFDVKATSQDYTFDVRVALSPNKRSIWLMSYLDDVPATVEASRLRALLEAINSKTGKMQFRLVGEQLKADQPLDNVGVTPARLRRELDDFAASLQDTDTLWNVKKWKKEEPKAEKVEKAEKPKEEGK